MERDGGEDKGAAHARDGEARDAATAGLVDDDERDEGEGQVDDGDDEADDERVVEPDVLEQGRRVVHERVEAAQLLDALQAARDDEGAEVGRVEVQPLPRLDERRRVAHRVLDALADNVGLEVQLRLARVRVDLAQDVDRRLELVLAEEVARRLGEVQEHDELEGLRAGRTASAPCTEGEESAREEGRGTHRRNRAEADHPAPAVRDVLERQVEAVGDDLPERDGDDVERHEAPTERSRRELADVERDDERGKADAESEDEAADGDDPVGVRAVGDGLHNCGREREVSLGHLMKERRGRADALAPTMKMASARAMTALRPMRSACAHERESGRARRKELQARTHKYTGGEAGEERAERRGRGEDLRARSASATAARRWSEKDGRTSLFELLSGTRLRSAGTSLWTRAPPMTPVCERAREGVSGETQP